MIEPLRIEITGADVMVLINGAKTSALAGTTVGGKRYDGTGSADLPRS